MDDTIHGCVPIALKRASLMGRAPVIHDLVVAFTIWGFLDETAPDELVETRRSLFAGVAHPGHHVEREHLVAMVPIATLRLSPEEVRTPHSVDWRSLLDCKSRSTRTMADERSPVRRAVARGCYVERCGVGQRSAGGHRRSSDPQAQMLAFFGRDPR